ncbi:MAG: LysM peptidoglycan-binding domain-containing protein [Elusimicrobia bacterium]|nr:LysM peptidoglycan-binding domain-containing protein [Candidatus Obscuribacterium magneticum]
MNQKHCGILIALSFSLLVLVGASEEIFQEITVEPGDTMWGIANKYLKDPHRWPDLVKYNKLPTSDPTLALPGTKIRVPILLIKEEYRNAQLVSVVPEVRYQRKGTLDWAEATMDMTLHYEDSLRTMTEGRARVRFPSNEIVQINENSYVVLRPEKILQEVELLQGNIRASRARVVLPHGTVVQPKMANSDYHARIKEDETELVFVYKGKVDVTAKGKTVTVKEGFGTQVPKEAPPINPLPLKSFAEFNPADMPKESPIRTNIDPAKGLVTIAPPTAPPKETPASKGAKAVTDSQLFSNYRLQLATDDKFTRIILDKTQPFKSPFDYKRQPIPDGSYYMRVAFIDPLGIQGKFSEPILIIKDTQAPVISDLVPPDGQKFSGDDVYCDVKGHVTGAAMLSINGDVVFVNPSGEFYKFLTLKEGINVIRVVAQDVQENETVVERKVTYTK